MPPAFTLVAAQAVMVRAGTGTRSSGLTPGFQATVCSRVRSVGGSTRGDLSLMLLFATSVIGPQDALGPIYVGRASPGGSSPAPHGEDGSHASTAAPPTFGVMGGGFRH